MERNRIPAVIGALAGAVAYLLVGLLPSIVYGTYAGVLLAGGIVDVATATFWVKAFGVFGAILGVLGLGSLFVVLGNVLPRTRSNWFMGIRTPWTLESESVWRATHALAGRTFIAGGLITMAAAFMPPRLQPWIAMGALVIGAFVPVVYSYFVWRRETQG